MHPADLADIVEELGRADRELLHGDHIGMLDAFVDRDPDALTAVFADHHHRLQHSISTLPTDTGLFIE